MHDPFVKDKKHKIIDFDSIKKSQFDGIVIAVPHKFYINKINKIKNFLKPDGFIFDIKGRLNLNSKDKINYWSL